MMQGGGAAAEEPPTARPGQHEAGRGHGNLSARLSAPGFVCISLGGTIMCLLLLHPVWNSIIMLKNPVLLHFMGRELPDAIITACVLLVVLYVVAVMLFFRQSRKAAQSEQNVMMIANVFVTMLGALVLIISMPVRALGVEVQLEITGKCQHGLRTHDLYMTYNSLVALRRTSECASLASVESCAGFRPSSTADLLKAMETKYQCSGWCAPPKLQSAYRAPGVAFLQLDSQQEEHRPVGRSSRAWAFSELRTRPALTETIPAGTTPTYVYPPALFSQLTYQSSCNGMAARELHYFLVDTGDQLYYEGLYLMFISIGIGMLKLLGFCLKDNIFTKMRQGKYGATDAESAGQRYVSEDAGRRYVSGGVLR